jgi:hypothetical protein
MNRRGLLSAAAPAALALVGGAAAAPVALSLGVSLPLTERDAVAASVAPISDAELLALCAKFHRLHVEGADEANPAWEKANADAWDAFNEIDDLTPQTEAGHRAKAAVAVEMLTMFHTGPNGGDPEAVFALNMLRDWLGSVAA